MNKEQFDRISKDRVIHAHLVFEDEPFHPQGELRSFGYPAICRFSGDGVTFSDYFSKEELLNIPYNELKQAEVSVCSRLGTVRMLPYSFYHGRLSLVRTDSRVFVIEFSPLDAFLRVREMMDRNQVPVNDVLQLFPVLEREDEEHIYEHIQKNIDSWSKLYGVSNPATGDMV